MRPILQLLLYSYFTLLLGSSECADVLPPACAAALCPVEDYRYICLYSLRINRRGQVHVRGARAYIGYSLKVYL